MADGEGFYFFSSRDDDVIILAGYRIGPFDVESVLSTHPAVGESAVVGAPDELRGEVLEAYVVLTERATGDDALIHELQDLVKTQYAAHAFPPAAYTSSTNFLRHPPARSSAYPAQGKSEQSKVLKFPQRESTDQDSK